MPRDSRNTLKRTNEVSIKDLWELAKRIEESMGHEDANLLRSFLERIEGNGRVDYSNIRKGRMDE